MVERSVTSSGHYSMLSKQFFVGCPVLGRAAYSLFFFVLCDSIFENNWVLHWDSVVLWDGVRICILIYAALHKMLFYEVMFCYSIGRWTKTTRAVVLKDALFWGIPLALKQGWWIMRRFMRLNFWQEIYEVLICILTYISTSWNTEYRFWKAA